MVHLIIVGLAGAREAICRHINYQVLSYHRAHLIIVKVTILPVSALCLPYHLDSTLLRIVILNSTDLFSSTVLKYYLSLIHI